MDDIRAQNEISKAIQMIPPFKPESSSKIENADSRWIRQLEILRELQKTATAEQMKVLNEWKKKFHPFFAEWMFGLFLQDFIVSKSESNDKVSVRELSGGVLTISEETLMGRGGCGRGSCENQPKIISAQFVNMNGDEFYYGCSKISQ